jgi:hypothetical protein
VGLGILVLLVLLRMALRSERAAGLGLLLILGIPDAIVSDLPWYAALLLAMAIMSLGVLVLLRFGLLALIVTLYTCSRVLTAPFGLRLDHWTGAPTAFSLLVIAALVAWGLWASASRRRLAVVHDLAA